MKLDAKDLERLPHTEFRNRDLLKKAKISGVSTDSRKVSPGNVFIALKGENFNGNSFIEDAFDKGAIVAIVDKAFNSDSVPGKPLLVVENTTHTLGELGHLYRMKFEIPVIAIGGSNGKTTTKDMIGAVLATTFNVLKTEGNLNNHIGVPQTLFCLRKKHDVAVIEIGTNHPGEIDYLCRILSPTHGLITNIGREHLEFFKSVEGVAKEETVLFDYLKKSKKSVAFVNADDELVSSSVGRMKHPVRYGMQASRSNVRGTMAGADESGCVGFQYVSRKPAKRDTIQLGIPGDHNALNALAAVAVGLTFKVPAKRIRNALESFRASSKRMQILDYEGVLIYNDTYNANPDSMISALRTLALAKVPGKKIAVLGDMRELGEFARAEHVRVGVEAKRLQIDYVLTHGELARHIHDAANAEGAFHYEQKNMLAEYLSELIAPGDAVLVKGSRGMKMEDIVTFLEERLHSTTVPLV